MNLNHDVGHAANAFGDDWSCACTNDKVLYLTTLEDVIHIRVGDRNGINGRGPEILDSNSNGGRCHLGGHNGVLVVDTFLLVLNISDHHGRLIEAVRAVGLADRDAREREIVAYVFGGIGSRTGIAFINIQTACSDVQVHRNFGIAVHAFRGVGLFSSKCNERPGGNILGGHRTGAGDSSCGSVVNRKHLGTLRKPKLGNGELNFVHFHGGDGDSSWDEWGCSIANSFSQHGAHEVHTIVSDGR